MLGVQASMRSKSFRFKNAVSVASSRKFTIWDSYMSCDQIMASRVSRIAQHTMRLLRRVAKLSSLELGWGYLGGFKNARMWLSMGRLALTLSLSPGRWSAEAVDFVEATSWVSSDELSDVSADSLAANHR
jgi:hypothetical protein